MAKFETQQLYIHGVRVDASGTDIFSSINPANGEVLALVQQATHADVERAVCRVEHNSLQRRARHAGGAVSIG